MRPFPVIVTSAADFSVFDLFLASNDNVSLLRTQIAAKAKAVLFCQSTFSVVQAHLLQHTCYSLRNPYPTTGHTKRTR